MHRSLIWALALVAGVAVCDASAQSAAPPAELGLEVAALVPNINGPQLGPRLVVNFDGRTSVQFMASFQKLSRLDDSARSKTDAYLVAYRRLVHTDGPVRVFATIGGGLTRTFIVTDPQTFGNPPITFAATSGAEVLPAFTTGAAIDFRLPGRAAIVLESAFVLRDTLGARFSGVLVVPVGSNRSRPERLASSVPWAELDAGDRAWVTTGDGREVDGEVVWRTAGTLTLRTRTGMAAFAAGDVREIDTTDPIRNGTVLGLKIGTFGAIVPAFFVTLLFCSLDDGCSAGEILGVNSLFFGIGAGVGAATGALTDSLRERRVPVYRRGGSTRVMVAPIVGGHRLGGRAVIRW